MLFRNRHESSLDRLEKEANDDFKLLQELGPEHFGSSHLLDLREIIRQRLDHFDRAKKILLFLGALSAGCFLGGLVCLVLKWKLMSAIFYSLSILCMLGFLGGVWWLKWKYESRGELMDALMQVEEELRQRAPLKGRGATSR